MMKTNTSAGNASKKPSGAKSKTARSSKKSLSNGRPPTVRKTPTSLSHKATNTVINTYHALNKSLTRARAAGDDSKASALESQLEQLGGLESYQRASIQGQEGRRGGDSSIILVDWLKPLLNQQNRGQKPRLLEIGALSTQNACSNSGLFEVERIDLNSQGDGIQRQDFMERPLPDSNSGKGEAERFDILSLSLVLNFVPDIAQRGEMLRRTTAFLSRRHKRVEGARDADSSLPCLFLVLPAPCVTNSRYMSEERLTAIMESLGYSLLHRKQSPRLVYYLWRWQDENMADVQFRDFPKKLICDGKGRNNFAIVLKG